MKLARVAAWVLLASMAVLVLAGAAFWWKGYRVYAVRTGSMAPTYPTGSLVLDRPTTPDRLHTGSVITFRIGSELVTHRLATTGAGGLTTKGDANRTADPWTLPAGNVVGEVVGGLEHGGYVVVFLHQPTGVPSLVLLLISLLLAWQVFFGTSAPRRPRDPSPLGVAAVVLVLAVVGGAASSSWVGVRSTGAWFSDSRAGTLSFDLGCADTHDHGNGPVNGNGHKKCQGNGHDKDSAAEEVAQAIAPDGG